MALTRDEILKADDIEIEEVEVPEWGGSVYVRGLTAEQRDQYEQSLIVRKGKKSDINLVNARARLVALTVVDENGDSLFTLADAEALGQKSAAALQRVFEVAQRLSGLTEEDVEELVGN